MAANSSFHANNDYSISQLTHWFGNVPRLGTNFQTVHNLTLLDDKEFVQSMAMYAFIAAIALVVASVILVLFCCCNAMFRSWPKYGAKTPGRSCALPAQFLLLVFAILGAASFAIGFVGEFKVHSVASETCNTVDFVDNRVHLIKNETDLIVQQLNVTETMVKLHAELSEAIAEMAQILSSSTGFLHQFSDYFNNLQDEISKTREIIKQKIIEDILERVIDLLRPIREVCPSVSQWAHVANLLVLSVLALSSLFFVLGFYRNCFRFVACTLGYLLWITLFAFGTLVFVALIGGSDFCASSKKVLDKYISTPVNDYYLYCPKRENPFACQMNLERLTFPANALKVKLPPIPPLPSLPQVPSFSQSGAIDEMVHQASCFVNQSKAIVKQVSDSFTDSMSSWCKGNQSMTNIDHLCVAIARIDRLVIGPGNESYASLLNRLETVSQSISRIEVNVDCATITPEINRQLSRICTNMYDALFYFLVNSFCAILCFFLLLLLSIWLIFNHCVGEDDPVCPSAPPSAYINPHVHPSLYMSQFVWKDDGNRHRSDKTTVL